MLKYLKYTTACDVAFGAFVIMWAISRHAIFLVICWSVYADLPANIEYGCYQGSSAGLEGPFDPPDKFMHLLLPFQSPTGVVCQTKTTTNIWLAMLLFLQGIMMVWFTMIIRVILKVISGEAPDDIRSDDECEEQYDDGKEGFEQSHHDYIEVPPLEEEVGADGINLNGRKTSPPRIIRNYPGVASGVSLPIDRKELLGRIGCDKSS